MRGWRAAVFLTVYLLVISLFALLFYWLLESTTSFTGEPSQVGKNLFRAIVVFQLIMVALLTPAFTAGSITSEREQKTYDLLMTTLLPARSIIFGKLGSALAFVALLILALAPLESLAFIFGGVSPEEIILSQVTVLAAALLYACIGIFWSSFLRSSVASNVLSYGTILFQMLGVPFLYVVAITILEAYTYNPNGNNINNESAYFYGTGALLSANPLIALGISDAFVSSGDPLFIYNSTTKINGRNLLVVSPWLVFCAEALLGSAVLVLLSIRNVKPTHSRARKERPAPSVPATAPASGYPVSAPPPQLPITQPPEQTPTQPVGPPRDQV